MKHTREATVTHKFELTDNEAYKLLNEIEHLSDTTGLMRFPVTGELYEILCRRNTV